jgi:hypothetical protein
MTASTVALIGALVHEYPELLPVLDESLSDNDGEVLAHLVMSDVFRWLVEHRQDRAEVGQRILVWLESAYQRGNQDVRDLIGASGVEMIPDPGHDGAELRALLGPYLRAADPWSVTQGRP